jgi:hypothetical protein
MGSKKEIEAIIRGLRAFDSKAVELTKNSHYRIKCPDGSLYFTGSTPSDYRVLRKVKNELVKRGFPPDVVCLQTTEDIKEYCFVMEPMTDDEWEEFCDIPEHELHKLSNDDFASMGSLVRLSARHDVITNGRGWRDDYKGTPPFLVLGWYVLIDRSNQMEPIRIDGPEYEDKRFIYAKGMWKGSPHYIAAFPWLYSVEVLNK